MKDILVIPYRNLKEAEDEDFSGCFAEKPEQTLRREIQEETGVIIIKCSFLQQKEKRISDDHTKYSFWVDEFDDSNLRTKVSPYQQEILVPFWCPIELLVKYISPSHKWIMEKVYHGPITSTSFTRTTLFSEEKSVYRKGESSVQAYPIAG